MLRKHLVPWISQNLSWLTIAVLLVPITAVAPYNNGPPIRSDGVGYHLWTRALLERDFTFCRFREMEETRAISHRDPARGVCQNKYPPGVALLRFPVMAPLVDRSPDGEFITPAEHLACLILSGIALVLVVALTLMSCRRLRISNAGSNFAALAVVFGTGLFHYSTYDASFSHIYSAVGIAILVFLTARARGSPGVPPNLWVLGVAVFFLMTVRSTNAIAIAAWAMGHLAWPRLAGAGSWWNVEREERRLILTVGAGFLLAMSLQAVYGWYALGRLSLWSYGEEQFVLNRPMAHKVLLSYERGLFTYYPVLALVLAAALAARRTRLAALWISGTWMAYAVLYGFWHEWYLGGGFGHRGFVELMPAAIVLFAAAWDSLPRWSRGPVALLSACCVGVTLQLMTGYWRGSFPFAGGTRAQYWSHIAGPDSLLVQVRR